MSDSKSGKYRMLTKLLCEILLIFKFYRVRKEHESRLLCENINSKISVISNCFFVSVFTCNFLLDSSTHEEKVGGVFPLIYYNNWVQVQC